MEIVSRKTNESNKPHQWWICTYHLHEDIELEYAKTIWRAAMDEFKADYSVSQLEKCPTTGKLHIQGALYYQDPVRGSRFKGFPCWIEPSKAAGGRKLVEYCKKNSTREDGPYEYGIAPQARGTKGQVYVDAKEHLQKGGKVKDLPPEIIFKNLGNAQKYAAMLAPSYTPPEGTPRGLWIHGRSRSGKSYFARNIDANFYLKSADAWWENYQQQKTILLEDMDKSCTGITRHLKIWMDVYAVDNQAVKNSSANIAHDLFIITSQYRPDEIWTDFETIEAITLRCRIIHISNRKIVYDLINTYPEYEYLKDEYERNHQVYN